MAKLKLSFIGNIVVVSEFILLKEIVHFRCFVHPQDREDFVRALRDKTFGVEIQGKIFTEFYQFAASASNFFDMKGDVEDSSMLQQLVCGEPVEWSC